MSRIVAKNGRTVKTGLGASFLRHQDGDRFVTVMAVDAEVPIESEHAAIAMQFSQSYQRGIGQGHRDAAIFAHQRPQSSALAIELNPHRDHSGVCQRK